MASSLALAENEKVEDDVVDEIEDDVVDEIEDDVVDDEKFDMEVKSTLSSSSSVGSSVSTKGQSKSKEQAPIDKDPETLKARKTVKKYFIENSSYAASDIDMTKILISAGMIKIYKCHGDKCKVEDKWHRKTLTLILARKNKVENDLRPANLELLCPNCYCANYTRSIPSKLIPRKYNCKICGFDITKFGKMYIDSGICKVCARNSVNRYENCLTTSYEDELSKYCVRTFEPVQHGEDGKLRQKVNKSASVSASASAITIAKHGGIGSKKSTSDTRDEPVLSINLEIGKTVEMLLADAEDAVEDAN